jgi:hypothetical protein
MVTRGSACDATLRPKLGCCTSVRRMIIAIVRFPINPAMSVDEATASYTASAPSYQMLAGLIRKHYLLGEGGTVGGGVYLWESRAAAEAVYNEAWSERLSARFGTAPTIEYFENPVTVDPDSILVGSV